jgi:hypothetical protein
MPFDSTWPPDHAELDGAPFRAQFNGLNDLITDLQNQVSALQTQLNGVSQLVIAVNDPPQQAEVMALLAKLNELIVAGQQP